GRDQVGIRRTAEGRGVAAGLRAHQLPGLIVNVPLGAADGHEGVLVEPTPARPLPVAGRTTGALGLARAVVLLAIAGPGDGQRVGGELAAAGGGIAAGGVVEATVARLERLGRAAGERQETQRRAENDRTPAKVRH